MAVVLIVVPGRIYNVLVMTVIDPHGLEFKGFGFMVGWWFSVEDYRTVVGFYHG